MFGYWGDCVYVELKWGGWYGFAGEIRSGMRVGVECVCVCWVCVCVWGWGRGLWMDVWLL